MPATATLTSTTLAQAVNASDLRIKLASTSGVYPGLSLYISAISGSGELVRVVRLEPDPWVTVTRGVDGSKAQGHSAGETVYIGRADQFYCCPPMGRPDAAIPVSPYIDVQAGRVYFAQGDTTPSATADRWWSEQTNTRTSGPLGVRTTTLDPTSST